VFEHVAGTSGHAGARCGASVPYAGGADRRQFLYLGCCGRSVTQRLLASAFTYARCLLNFLGDGRDGGTPARTFRVVLRLQWPHSPVSPRPALVAGSGLGN